MIKAPSPATIRKTLEIIRKYGPMILTTAKKLNQAMKQRKKALPAAKLQEEESQVAQANDQKIDGCVKALRQHVKVINRNSGVLKGYAQIIEEITAQNEEMATLVEAMSRWLKVLTWSAGVSFVVAVAAILIAVLQ